MKKIKARERELKERERESSVRHSEGEKGRGETGYRLLFEIPNDDFRVKIFLKINFLHEIKSYFDSDFYLYYINI